MLLQERLVEILKELDPTTASGRRSSAQQPLEEDAEGDENGPAAVPHARGELGEDGGYVDPFVAAGLDRYGGFGRYVGA